MHPYELEYTKNTLSYLSCVKNLMRIGQYSGFREKKDGILIPVRWSFKKNCLVVDRGTSLYRDIEGVDLKNINNYFCNEEIIYKAIKFTLESLEKSPFKEILNKYNAIKNTNKFIAFEYVNFKTNLIDNKTECIFPIGLFEFVNCNKRNTRFTTKREEKSVLLDLNIDIKEIDNINKINTFYIKDYNFLYSDFLYKLKNKTVEYKSEIENKTLTFSLSDYVEKNKKIKKDFFLKDYKESLKTKVIKNKKINIDVLLLLEINMFLGHFIKKEFKMEDAEGFVFYDDVSKSFIKLTSDFFLNIKSFKCDKKENIIDYNYNFLPGVF